MEGFDPVSVGRLLLAVALGGRVGLERQIHGGPARLRTHILVCLGSGVIVKSKKIVLDQVFGSEMSSSRRNAAIPWTISFSLTE